MSSRLDAVRGLGHRDPAVSGFGQTPTSLIAEWPVSALAIIGEDQRARDLMEKLLRVASPLGLLAEEFDVDTGRHLGNFPQTFSDLAPIQKPQSGSLPSGCRSSRIRHRGMAASTIRR